ncbi:MAG: ABC transporter ATP-binding protein [Verrucomicrobiota bacterium]|nr:ABC transporter ATP-binding protein [Verrucomicrobiota bacterium]MEC8866192.1 ABC transporter ATP-binding protein [Verrucomicrobiota bacterium]
MKQSNSKKVISRVSSYLFQHKWLFGLTLSLACIMTVVTVTVPLAIQKVLDKLIASNSKDGSFLLEGILIIASLFLLKEILNCLRIRTNNKLEQKVILRLRSDLHAKLLNLPIGFYDKRKSGDIASRVVEDVQNVERAILDGTEQGVIALLTLIGATVMMFTQEPRLATLVFLPLPILMVMAFRYSKISKKNWREVRETSGELNSLLVEDIQGNRLIQAFALRDREIKRFRKIGIELQKRSLRAMYRWSVQGPSASFTSSLGILAVVGMGAHLLQNDPNFTTGKFFAFLLYANIFYEPVRQLVSINNLVSAGKASGERVFEILDEPIRIQNPPEPVSFPKSDCSIRFQSVSFSYGSRGNIVENLDFEIPNQSTTALVGPTGAGKSTIANLLLRYYDVNSGSINIGNAELRNLRLEDLRQNIGFVSQDPFLFDASIKENLLLADRSKGDSDLEKALHAACALDFVRKLPDHWNTVIGERGIRLSMGEKQRLTLARAILKSPSIIVLDEATSSVDVETERYIQEGLSNLIKKRTTLIIAHRLSTIREADQIVFLEKGKIVEQGRHESLIEKGGKYSSFYDYQENLITLE